MKRRLFSLAILGLLLATFLVVPAPTRAGIVPLPWSTPPKYRILYLLAPEAVAPNSSMAPARLEAALGVETVYSGHEVVAQDQLAPVDALVIHASAITMLDSEWLSKTYWRGTVVGVFNVDALQLAEIVQDLCISRGEFASEPYPGDFYLAASHIVVGPPEDVALVKSSGYCGEKQVQGVQGQLAELLARSTDQLLGESEFNQFARALVNQLDAVKETRQDYPAP